MTTIQAGDKTPGGHRYIGVLRRPENDSEFRSGAKPLTQTLPAFDEAGFPKRPVLHHLFDQLVRDLCDVDEDTLRERPP